jgi:hypothetical protein
LKEKRKKAGETAYPTKAKKAKREEGKGAYEGGGCFPDQEIA